jgi:D-alanyl-D-alanine carboxypeptidase
MSRRMVAVALGALFLAPVSASAATPPLIEGRAALIMNAASGQVLYDLRADEAAAPASLAKMASALVITERLKPSDSVRISHAAAIAHEDSILWPEGATFTVDQVLHGMIMESSNGAAVALAERAAGSVSTFMSLVNEKVAALGARNTHLETPHGLDANGQKSTARDLATIARAYLNVPWLASVSATLTYQVLRWPPRDEARTFRNRNDFVRSYRGAVGLKNGYTSKAGNSVAAAAARGEVVLIAVVLNDRNVYGDAASLMDYGFSLTGVGTAAPPQAAPAATSAPVAAAPSTASAPLTDPQIPQTEQFDRRTPPSFAPTPASSKAKSASLPIKKLTLFGLAFAYVGRVVQVRGRVKQRRRAPARAARSQAMQPMYIPLQRTGQRPVARRSSSNARLRVAGERDVPQSRSRNRAL